MNTKNTLTDPRLNRIFILPTEEDEARIQAGIASDPDSRSLTDDEWEAVKPKLKLGRPKSNNPKISIRVRYDANIIEYFKATGKGWQTRMNEVLQNYVISH